MTTNAIGHNGAGLSAQASNAKIRGCIQRVRNTLGTYRETVQEALLLIWQHSLDFGDCTAAARLMREAAPKDRPAIDKWLKAASPIRVTMGKTSAEDKARLAKPTQASYTPYDKEIATSLLWWDQPVEPGEEAPLPGLVDYFDAVERAINKPVSTANSLNKYSEREQEAIAAEAAAIKALFNKYRAQRLAGVIDGEFKVVQERAA